MNNINIYTWNVCNWALIGANYLGPVVQTVLVSMILVLVYMCRTEKYWLTTNRNNSALRLAVSKLFTHVHCSDMPSTIVHRWRAAQMRLCCWPSIPVGDYKHVCFPKGQSRPKRFCSQVNNPPKIFKYSVVYWPGGRTDMLIHPSSPCIYQWTAGHLRCFSSRCSGPVLILDQFRPFWIWRKFEANLWIATVNLPFIDC